MLRIFIELLILLLLVPFATMAQNYFVKHGDTLWLRSGGDSTRIVMPAQLNTNFEDSIGYGTKANAKFTVSNVKCLTCPMPQTGTLLHIISEGTTNGRISHDSYNNGSATGSILQGRRGRGLANSPTAALQDDIGVAIGADFFGTTAFRGVSLGGLSVRADANITDISAPTYVNITTTPSGAIAAVERVRIKSDGVVRVGSLASVGFVQSDATGNLATALLTAAQISAALGYTPANAAGTLDPTLYYTKTASDSRYLQTETDPTFNTKFAAKTTTDLTEGTNQYFTTTRARAAFSNGTGIGLSSGVISNTSPDQVVSITPAGYGLSVSGTYPTFIITNTAPTFNNSPSVTLNTSVQLSTTKNTRVSYTVSVASLVSVGQALAYLEISANNSVWVQISSAGETSVGLLNTKYYNLQGEIPSGWYRRIRTSVTLGGTVAFISGQEVSY